MAGVEAIAGRRWSTKKFFDASFRCFVALAGLAKAWKFNISSTLIWGVGWRILRQIRARYDSLVHFPLAENAWKSVVLGKNKIALLGNLIDVFYPCYWGQSYSTALMGVAGRCWRTKKFYLASWLCTKATKWVTAAAAVIHFVALVHSQEAK